MTGRHRGAVMSTQALPAILCVEDDAIALIARKMVLEGQGYRVLTAHDPTAALDLFTHNEVDLVVTDHLLRGLTGTQIAAEMKRLKPAVPIVVLSGEVATTNDIGNADLLVSKHEGVETVLAKITALLDRTRKRRRTP